MTLQLADSGFNQNNFDSSHIFLPSKGMFVRADLSDNMPFADFCSTLKEEGYTNEQIGILAAKRAERKATKTDAKATKKTTKAATKQQKATDKGTRKQTRAELKTRVPGEQKGDLLKTLVKTAAKSTSKFTGYVDTPEPSEGGGGGATQSTAPTTTPGGGENFLVKYKTPLIIGGIAIAAIIILQKVSKKK